MIEPVLIEPNGLYDDGALHQALGLTSATLAKARKSGALRHSRLGNRTLYRGSWILAWLESGSAQANTPEICPRRNGGAE